MQEMLFCGTGSFKDVDKGACGGKAPDAEAKQKEKKKKTGGKKENPYASRGLDKFSTVLSELESRREKILRRVGPADGDRFMVRFVQTEAKGWVPVVVKLPPEEQQQQQQQQKGCKKRKQATSPTILSQPSTPPTSEPASPREDVVKHPAVAPKATAVSGATPAKKDTGERWSWSWGKKVRPSHYMPFVPVLLLVSLVVFGRLFAICFTSVWWYLVPILTGSDHSGGARRATAAKVGKDLGAKKASDKKISEKLVASLPPCKKSSSGAHEVISPRSHPHGKKG